MKKIKILLLSLITIVFNGCFGFSPKVDVVRFQNNVSQKLTIPKICKPIYRSKGRGVAVVNFTNNSTFSGNSSRISQSLVGVMESIIKQIEGFSLYSREDMAKIEAEQKFQDSGLVDDSSLIEFGEIMGVRYIITGSLDGVQINNRDYSQFGNVAAFAGLNSNNKKAQIAGLLVGVVSHIVSGTKIKVTVNVKMLDVQNGKVIFSQSVTDSVTVGNGQNLSDGVIIGAIKSASISAMPKIKKPISEMAQLQGYITKIKFNDGDYIGQINLGKNDGLKKGDKFMLYNPSQNIDPLSGKQNCELLNSGIRLTISNQIGENYSWGVLSGKMDRVRIYQMVKKSE